MAKQSISYTRPDDEWIRTKLEKAEDSGFTDGTKYQILKESKASFNG